MKVEESSSGAVREIRIHPGDYVEAKEFTKIPPKGVRIFDPGFINTAAVKSAICFIDGDAGVLEYRGYPIEELAEKSTFLEVAYLLIYGELPSKTEYAEWREKIMKNTFMNNQMSDLMGSFNYDAHPMGMFISSMAALSTFHAEANPALQVEPHPAPVTDTCRARTSTRITTSW